MKKEGIAPARGRLRLARRIAWHDTAYQGTFSQPPSLASRRISSSLADTIG